MIIKGLIVQNLELLKKLMTVKGHPPFNIYGRNTMNEVNGLYVLYKRSKINLTNTQKIKSYKIFTKEKSYNLQQMKN